MNLLGRKKSTAQAEVDAASATAAEDTERELALRIPAWSAAAGSLVAELNGSPERFVIPPGRYLRLRRSWRPGDVLRLHLDLTPRWTHPDQRADALRGCVAVERGPLVYCFEQADQPARLDEVAVFPGEPLTEEAVTLPGIGRTIQLTASGARPAQRVTLTAVPYFQWDNRGPGAMRVWIPAATATAVLPPEAAPQAP